MGKLLLFLSFLAPLCSLRSQIYICRDGHIKFTSEAPLELIKAETSKTNGALDATNKTVAFSVEINSFDGFNSALQKEHFRENYMESDKYPKATFKGKIIEDVDFSQKGPITVRAKGLFNIHGVDKERILKVKLNLNGSEIGVDTDFDVPLEDHNIKIPKVVNQKISSVITVNVKATLKPKA